MTVSEIKTCRTAWQRNIYIFIKTLMKTVCHDRKLQRAGGGGSPVPELWRKITSEFLVEKQTRAASRGSFKHE